MSRLDLFQKKFDKYREKFPFYFHPIDAQYGPFIEANNQKLLNFTSFSYLGLYDHPDLIKASQNASSKWGVGVQGTRMLGGNLSLYNQLEETIANFLDRDSALIFQSGYVANVSTIQSLLKKQDIVFCARKNHASILDGCKISGADIRYFDHQNLDDLKKILLESPKEKTKLIISDSVFSMDGDLVNLPALLEMRDCVPNTILMIDESHSLGVVGQNGRGIEEHFNIDPSKGVDLKIASLSKAIPGNGGIIAGNEKLIRYLRFQARHVIFSSGLSPASAASTKAAFEILKTQGSDLVKSFHEKIKLLRSLLHSADLNKHSPITSVMINNENKAFEISQKCFENGLFLLPVAFPAVKRGKERLRITITVNHSDQQIKEGLSILKKFL